MKRGPGLAALGLLVLWLQGTLATLAPDLPFPDLVFLTVVGIAIAVGGIEGLLVTAAVGYAMDLLTGALLGEHALLLVMAYAATRIANLQLNLLRPVPRAVFVAALTLGYHLGHAGLVRLFSDVTAGLDGSFFSSVLLQAGLNALCAPAGVAVVQRMSAILSGEEEPGRRPLRVQPRGRAL